MKRVERKVLFECHVGSVLYGTNRPDSDTDLMGVYLPSTEDMFSLHAGPDELDLGVKSSPGTKNTKDDKDHKLYRLDKFLRMLSEGQSKQVEMLFSPRSVWVTSSPEWEMLTGNKEMFLSKLSLVSFTQFAKAQSMKAVMKGENLNNLTKLVEVLKTKTLTKTLHAELDLLTLEKEGLFKLVTLQDGVPGMEVAGKKYLLKEKVKDTLKKMEKLLNQYGPRSQQAATTGYDYKSLSHAYRLLFMGEELLSTGKLTLPMKPEHVTFLKSVRSGTYEAAYWDELDLMAKNVLQLPTKLPDQPDMEKVNKLCQEMMTRHFS